MSGEFTLDSTGLAPLSNLHTEVADGLAQLAGVSAPATAEVAQSFGTIAFGVNNALANASQSRVDTLGAAGSAGNAISDILRAADAKYAAGDQAAEDRLGQAVQTAGQRSPL